MVIHEAVVSSGFQDVVCPGPTHRLPYIPGIDSLPCASCRREIACLTQIVESWRRVVGRLESCIFKRLASQANGQVAAPFAVEDAAPVGGETLAVVDAFGSIVKTGECFR